MAVEGIWSFSRVAAVNVTFSEKNKKIRFQICSRGACVSNLKPLSYVAWSVEGGQIDKHKDIRPNKEIPTACTRPVNSINNKAIKEKCRNSCNTAVFRG